MGDVQGVRDQGDIARPFYRPRQLALMSGTYAGYPARDDFALLGHETTQGSNILVIHFAIAILTKLTDLPSAYKCHVIPPLSSRKSLVYKSDL
jgi:hypothetical protein